MALLVAGLGFQASHVPRSQQRSCAVVRACASAATEPVAEPAIKPPSDQQQMLTQAADCVARARAAGSSRFVLRLFLPRGEGLSPPDESWQGGIMQLYAACSPLVRELLRQLSTEVAGVPPALREQRIDASGVDGESVWFAQSAQPQDDGVAFVQPMAESIATIRKLSNEAGGRPLLLVNPQWKERDDPLDALSRKEGLLGMMGNVIVPPLERRKPVLPLWHVCRLHRLTQFCLMPPYAVHGRQGGYGSRAQRDGFYRCVHARRV